MTRAETWVQVYRAPKQPGPPGQPRTAADLAQYHGTTVVESYDPERIDWTRDGRLWRRVR